MSGSLTKGLIGLEDLSLGTGTFTRVSSTGGTVTLNKINLGLTYDRGDPSANDWTNASLTKDGAYHTLDCSAIVSENARFISFKVVATPGAAEEAMYFRKYGNTNSINIKGFYSLVASKLHFFNIENVPCDTSRRVEYLIPAGWSINNITVTGWTM